ncbi:MAG: prolyl oligopeptidase family serine peptidase [Egibacteraceae bacterium]
MTVPYGAWPSPVTADLVAGAATRLDQVVLGEPVVYWLEGRPAEGGRQVVVARDDGGVPRDATPAELNVRTLAHEYGGGDYAVHGRTVFCANLADQRLYRVDAAGARPITPEPTLPRGDRYADMDVTPDGRWIYCVREHHRSEGEPINAIVVLPTDGSAEPRVVAAGHDFCAYPRVSPDGERLAWTTWDHPRMPWDGSELWQARIRPDGTLDEPRLVAGGPRESIFQPAWGPDGVLHFVSDRTGWWNLYRDTGTGVEPIAPAEAEFGMPQWVFGMSTYAFLDDGRIACAVTERGITRLGIVEDGVLRPLDLPYTACVSLRGRGQRLAFVAASPAQPSAVIRLDRTWSPEVVARSLTLDLDPDLISAPEPITFPTVGGATAHALYYPPRNPSAEASAQERPPLLVNSHGGPTSHVPAVVSLQRVFWTSRGFAVVEVNYRGSTGYGRAYRDALAGQWGIADVDDCIAAGRFLAERGDVDPERIAIRGGSAGGYTTLCALAFRDFFAVGVSHYGVADPAALAIETHKFESRYLDKLIGPWPEAETVYRERAPLYHADQIQRPVLLLQGLEDAVVPPAQAEHMVAALEQRGVPHAYVAFAGEQHGFRRAETVRAAHDAELSFYAQLFGFTPSGDVPRLQIEGLG